MQYFLTSAEMERMKNALKTAIAIPLIDDIEDYILEDIWKYVKQIDGLDPLYNIRSKDLYDVVDSTNNIGWSIKSIQCNFYGNCEFELVVQRADVFKKSLHLIGCSLSINSDPNLIGKALLKHWSQKVLGDAEKQGVTSKRILILLKNFERNKFAILEEDIKLFSDTEIEWQWTNDSKNGLKGIIKETGMCVYRWYPAQKQFFERFILPQAAPSFDISGIRLSESELIEIILKKVEQM